MRIAMFDTRTLVLALNRKVHRAFARVREWNFSLEGLVGFDLFGKTVGIVGTGKIGQVTARLFRGLGCRVLAYDVRPDPEFGREIGAEYVELAELYRRSNVVSLHVPLTPATFHRVDAAALASFRSRTPSAPRRGSSPRAEPRAGRPSSRQGPLRVAAHRRAR